MRTNYSAMVGLAVGALLVAGAGCVNSTTTNTNGTTANTNSTVTVSNTNATVEDDEAADADAGDYAIEIVEPADGDTVESTFDLTVDIANFALAPDKVEGENAEGEGHYHVWVDGEYLTPGVAETTTLEGIAAGEREIMVSLQNNDHTDLATPVKSEAVNVTVTEDAE